MSTGASASTCGARSAGSFALDATVNPDFGQVEVDPAVVNLSDFETFYPEKRPFFVQGRQTFDNFGSNGPNNHYGFDRSEPDLFYTRRIGRPPQGVGRRGVRPEPAVHHDPRGGEVHRQDRRRLERRGPRGGDRRASRRAGSTGTTGAGHQVEPLTNYFVARAFRDADRVGYGGLFTAVNRDLTDPGLQGQLVRSAYVGGRGRVRLPRRPEGLGRRRARWRGAGWTAAASRSRASSSRPSGTSSVRTAPSRDCDPTLTSLGGWTGSVNLNRQSGAVRVNASMWATSPGFESNDLGFNRRSDRWGGHLAIQLRQSRPDGFTRYRSLTVAKAYSLNYDQEKQGDSLNVYARARFNNYWNMGMSGYLRWRALADRATRGGPSMLSGRTRRGRLLARERRPQAARGPGERLPLAPTSGAAATGTARWRWRCTRPRRSPSRSAPRSPERTPWPSG